MRRKIPKKAEIKEMTFISFNEAMTKTDSLRYKTKISINGQSVCIRILSKTTLTPATMMITIAGDVLHHGLCRNVGVIIVLGIRNTR